MQSMNVCLIAALLVQLNGQEQCSKGLQDDQVDNVLKGKQSKHACLVAGLLVCYMKREQCS